MPTSLAPWLPPKVLWCWGAGGPQSLAGPPLTVREGPSSQGTPELEAPLRDGMLPEDALGSGLLGTVVPSLPAPTLLPGSPHRLSGHRGMGAGLGSPAPHGPGFRAHLSVAPRGLQSPAPVWWGHGEPWGAWWGCDCRTAPSPRGAPALGPNSCRRRAPDSSGPSGGGSVQACHPRRTLTHAGLQRLPPGMCQQLPRLRVL